MLAEASTHYIVRFLPAKMSVSAGAEDYSLFNSDAFHLLRIEGVEEGEDCKASTPTFAPSSWRVGASAKAEPVVAGPHGKVQAPKIRARKSRTFCAGHLRVLGLMEVTIAYGTNNSYALMTRVAH